MNNALLQLLLNIAACLKISVLKSFSLAIIVPAARISSHPCLFTAGMNVKYTRTGSKKSNLSEVVGRTLWWEDEDPAL